jgi:hypothetical protein
MQFGEATIQSSEASALRETTLSPELTSPAHSHAEQVAQLRAATASVKPYARMMMIGTATISVVLFAVVLFQSQKFS